MKSCLATRRSASILAIGAVLCGGLAAGGAQAAQAHRESFGVLPDGKAVAAVVLSNGHGVSARIIAYGAALQSLVTPDRNGRLGDVVLAYPDMSGYLAKPQFFGATVGRYANRIASGAFTLDGKAYSLAKNDGPNALHGGVKGFDKALWTVAQTHDGPTASVTFTHASPDGDEGYPGTLKASVTYALDEHDTLTISYAAVTDKPTVINLTNHSFFNLSGATSGLGIEGERLMIDADAYTPVDPTLIPTGELRPVAGTPFDFRTPQPIGARLHDGRESQLTITKGYDHNFVLKAGLTAEPKLAVRLEDPASGRVMELLTTEPGIQFYSGNFLDGTAVGKGGYIYRQTDGLALEPQKFPDSPNHPAFPSARLDPGQTYRHVSVYRFSILGS